MFGEVILKKKMIYKWVAKLGGGGGGERIPFHSQISEKSEKSEKFTLYSYKKGKLQISLLTHKDFIEFRKFEVFLS